MPWTLQVRAAAVLRREQAHLATRRQHPVRQNLSPLSFIGVPRALYTQAVLGVYERNRVDLLNDVFLWAYARSAQQYTSVRQSLGEPDPQAV
jgi:hypothetical protein